ncbi:hypothetical protein [Labedaea rhizosphaerae]|uniref:Excreted virulence factor EspC (Type VII ESX diderm) n=1 Tax=Labedaea rhizosphaerae TaxID=598644 RepID=A0A4R6S9J6_LABRH|nr:hypothetical protein [Labedaea rhizosphaerae]TDP96471.1 hypothetical protein EV186_104459 [Labedaea rhizosphaerae]
MSTTRRRTPATITSTLATATRTIDAAILAAELDDRPSVAELRATGWELARLTGELNGLATLLAQDIAQHTDHLDGGPAGPPLARAGRELAALRRALHDAHTAARGFYAETSRLMPTTT